MVSLLSGGICLGLGCGLVVVRNSAVFLLVYYSSGQGMHGLDSPGHPGGLVQTDYLLVRGFENHRRSSQQQHQQHSQQQRSSAPEQ